MSASHAARPAPLAEVAIAGLSLATVLGFARLFEGAGFVLPLAGAALGTHALASLARHRGWHLLTAAGLVAIALAVGASLTWYASTTALGVPTPATLSAMRADLGAAWDLFGSVVAPATAHTGFLLVSGVAVAFAAYLADWAAFRVRSPLEAITPTAILFVFGALLGSGQHRTSTAGLYVAAVFVYLLTDRAGMARLEGHWQLEGARRGPAALVRTGAAMGTAALVAAILVGPRLPGADDPALLSWQGTRESPGTRVTVSPLVDIRARLVAAGDVEVLRVRSDVRAYWRLTSLDTFDGTIWRSGGRYREVGEQLPSSLDDTVTAATAHQEVAVLALHQLWLPAAFEPLSIDAGTAEVRYEGDSGTLIIDTSQDDSDGLTYEVVSRVPRFDPARLQAAGSTIPDDIVERYLALPEGFSPTATALAAEVTAEADGPYAQALALQDHFRDTFTYDLEVGPGHGEPAIERFLEERRGYCEQFSGTYAAMARSLGIPARVAVGFTPGEVDDEDPDVYHVRGEHAHAWPEVWLAGAGWVAMEPTPGRGAPGAEAWTGVPEQQDGSGPVSTVTTQVAPSTTVRSGPDASAPTTTVAGAPSDADGELEEEPVQAAPLRAGLTTVLLALVALALLWSALVPLALVANRGLRLRRAPTHDARVLVLWGEAQRSLGSIGAIRHPSETHQEFALRARMVAGGPDEAIAELATLADLADYAGSTPDGAADRARSAEQRIRTHVTRRLGPRRRMGRWLDPRPLVPRARRAIDTRLASDEARVS